MSYHKNSGSFKKGNVSWLKGKKGYVNSGSFKNGHKQLNTGRTWIKKEEKRNLGKHWKIKDTSKMGGGWRGKKRLSFSEEHRKKLSETHKGLNSGNKHPNWKGGITPFRIKFWRSEEYKKWRSNVFQRDNWTCQTCGKRGCRLEAHHIKSFANYPELRLDISNGITLCFECHNLTKVGRRRRE